MIYYIIKMQIREDTTRDMKASVYIDTTIPSYYFDERESLRSFVEVTHRWWNEESSKYDIRVSLEVLCEFQEGNYPNKYKIIE